MKRGKDESLSLFFWRMTRIEIGLIAGSVQYFLICEKSYIVQSDLLWIIQWECEDEVRIIISRKVLLKTQTT
jgi:hypothetical protein